MDISLTTTPPWPAAPDPTSGPQTRMAWYAAVARWAPSKHNTQPWRFVARDASLEFWTDPLRILPATDPHRREMVISLGAAVHLARVAANATGYDVGVTLLPDGKGGPAATLAEVGTREPSPDDLDLLGAISERRTDRGPLDGGPLAPTLPFLMQSAASAQGCSLRLVSSPGDRLTLADLVQRADRLLLRRGSADRELAPWLHEPTAWRRRDGVPTDHTRGASASQRAEFVQRDFSTPTSTARPAQNRAGRDHPIVGVLCTPGDGMRDWLSAGQALGAVLLRATVAGANASYVNQPLEEIAIRAELRDQLQLDGIAQLVLRLGVGGAITPTPRRTLDDLIYQP